jgi:hypothetical protein
MAVDNVFVSTPISIGSHNMGCTRGVGSVLNLARRPTPDSCQPPVLANMLFSLAEPLPAPFTMYEAWEYAGNAATPS